MKKRLVVGVFLNAALLAGILHGAEEVATLECGVPACGTLVSQEAKTFDLRLERLEAFVVTVANSVDSASSSLVVDLLEADGTPVEGGAGFIRLSRAASDVGRFTLAAGDYRLQIRSLSNSPVQYTVEVSLLLRAKCLLPLSCGEPRSGQLPIGEHDTFEFTLDRIETLTVTASNATTSATSKLAADLLHAEGTPVKGGEAFMVVDGTKSGVGRFTLLPGDYRLQVRGLSRRLVQYTVEVTSLLREECALPLSCGEPTSGQLPIGEHDTFGFSLDHTETVTVTASNAATTVTSKLAVDLLHAEGTPVKGGEAFMVVDGTKSGVERFTLLPGDYRLQVRGLSRSVVRYTIELICPGFIRGDCDGDGDLERCVNDALTQLNWCFLGSAEPPCIAACDTDGDGDACSVSNAVFLLSWCFLGGPSPQPLGVCTRDTRGLDCKSGNCLPDVP